MMLYGHCEEHRLSCWKSKNLRLSSLMLWERFKGGSRGRVQWCSPPPPPPEMTCGFLIQPVFCQKKTMWFIGVEVEQETSAPPLEKILDPPLRFINKLSFET